MKTIQQQSLHKEQSESENYISTKPGLVFRQEAGKSLPAAGPSSCTPLHPA